MRRLLFFICFFSLSFAAWKGYRAFKKLDIPPVAVFFPPKSEKPITVLVASYNNEAYVKENMTSILNQKYKNFRVIYVNDCSSDKTGEKVRQITKKFNAEDRVLQIDNKERRGGLANLYHAIVERIPDHHIVVTVDGDDALAHPYVLRLINKVYSDPKKEVWMTYGQYRDKNSRQKGFCDEIPPSIVKHGLFRKWGMVPSHLRTYYAWLFKKIKKEDLLYGGDFYAMTWDVAMMIPMIEMAGDRFVFIPHVLYTYNDNNPISDHRINAKLQSDCNDYIRSLPSYKRLSSPHAAPHGA